MLTVRQRKDLWKKAGGSFTRMAGGMRCSVNHVRLVLLGERRSPRVEAAIAETICVSVEIAFPLRTVKRHRGPNKTKEFAA